MSSIMCSHACHGLCLLERGIQALCLPIAITGGCIGNGGTWPPTPESWHFKGRPAPWSCVWGHNSVGYVRSGMGTVTALGWGHCLGKSVVRRLGSLHISSSLLG